MFSTHPLDWAVLLLYFAWLIAVWLRLLRAPQGEDDYLLAGRRLTLPAFVASLVSTWYGGILGVGEYSWRHGVSNWLVFGVPYYVGALLFALLIARRARTDSSLTIPDLLERHYGRGPALAGAAAVFITAAPAAYVLMLGTLFAVMTGLPLVPCVIAAAVFSVFYIHRGGFTSVVVTDQVQFVLMYLGFGVLFAFLVAGHGGLEFIRPRVPDTHFTWHGGNPWPALVVWYVIALGTLVDPAFFQRAAAARDPATARRGVLISMGFWILFDFLTTSSGLYARALLPNLADPVQSFPELGKLVLPPVALGLFFLGLIATVMSTIDSYGFIAAVTIGRDIVGRLRRDTGTQVAFDVRIALWITAAVSVALALARRSVIGLWHDLGSITTPMLLLPVVTALLGRARLEPRWTLAAMLIPFALTLAWVLAKDFAPPGSPGGYPFSIEPIYAGLGASLLVYAAGHALKGGFAT